MTLGSEPGEARGAFVNLVLYDRMFCRCIPALHSWVRNHKIDIKAYARKHRSSTARHGRKSHLYCLCICILQACQQRAVGCSLGED